MTNNHAPPGEYSDLVAISDIAERIGVDSARISMLIKRREDDAPPAEHVAGGRRLFSWRKFAAFARRRGLLPREEGHIYDWQCFDVSDQYAHHAS